MTTTEESGRVREEVVKMFKEELAQKKNIPSCNSQKFSPMANSESAANCPYSVSL